MLNHVGGLFLCSLVFLPIGTVTSFAISVSPLSVLRSREGLCRCWDRSINARRQRQRNEGSFGGCIYMSSGSSSSSQSSPPDLESTDPWRVLGIPQRGLLQQPDAKEVKRVYKRLAMKYHPDVVTTKDSSTEEKKRASDRFAKINWAYSTILANKGQGTSAKSTASSSTGWEPPHRRTGAYSTQSNSDRRSDTDYASSDWRDYIPNSNKEESYDTGGDSFSQIFSDFVQSAVGSTTASAVGANGANGIFKDFVDFLEQNVDAYSSGSTGNTNDAEMRMLLQTGTVDEIGDEMDETELVVQQLSSKLGNVLSELVDVTADLAGAVGVSYLERMKQQERKDELQAQKTVVEGYLKRARTRLVSLQTRYKELIVQGQNDTRAGGQTNRERASPQSSSPSARTTSSPRPAPSATTNGSYGIGSSDSWKDEGFGSFGRGRSSSSRRSRQQRSSEQHATPSPSPINTPPSDSTRATSGSTRSSPSPTNGSTGAGNSESNVPPHRRSTTYYTDKLESERRLREIKVDEEFDKLKRELGL